MYSKKYVRLLLFFILIIGSQFIFVTEGLENIDGMEKQDNKYIYEIWNKSYQNTDDMDFPMGEELINERTEYSKTFVNNKEKIIYLVDEALHYKDVNNKWQDINTNLEKATNISSGYAYKNTENSLNVFFERDLSDGINIIIDEYDFYLTPLDILNPSAKVKGNKIEYNDVWENIDIYYKVKPGALKEYIVLKNKNAKNTFDFVIKANTSVNIEERKKGLFLIDSQTGKEIFLISQLFMFDKASTEAVYDH
ncbi:MAG TPA: hypothetical protein VKY40_08545, partial [Halanaerobiales bacterium]|nr:hypothetical protein [Halanaerobiales bacterium]